MQPAPAARARAAAARARLASSPGVRPLRSATIRAVAEDGIATRPPVNGTATTSAYRAVPASAPSHRRRREARALHRRCSALLGNRGAAPPALARTPRWARPRSGTAQATAASFCRSARTAAQPAMRAPERATRPSPTLLSIPGAPSSCAPPRTPSFPWINNVRTPACNAPIPRATAAARKPPRPPRRIRYGNASPSPRAVLNRLRALGRRARRRVSRATTASARAAVASFARAALGNPGSCPVRREGTKAKSA